MLHTLHRSPFVTDMVTLLSLLVPEDDLLLLQDGVIGALKNGQWLEPLLATKARIVVLQEDAIARGLVDQLSPRVAQITYSGFVELAVKHPQQMAW